MNDIAENQAINIFKNIRQLIDNSRQRVISIVNSELTLLYWNIGKLINADILDYNRADYGQQTVAMIADLLTNEFGKGWTVKTLRHCLRSAETFTEEQIVSAVQRQLSWTHLKTIMYLKDELQREFYMELCINERWSSRQLQERINSMLFERTAISRKPDQTKRIGRTSRTRYRRHTCGSILHRTATETTTAKEATRSYCHGKATDI